MSQGVPVFCLRLLLRDAILWIASNPRGANTAIKFSKFRQALGHVNYIQRSPAFFGSIHVFNLCLTDL